MIISPVDNQIFGISKSGNSREVECVLCKDMLDVHSSFPGARWRKNTSIYDKPSAEQQAQLQEVLRQRFEAARVLKSNSPVKLVFDTLFSLIELDGTEYPGHDDWRYVVYTSAKYFAAEYGKPLYCKEFPVVAMVYDKERKSLYEQVGVVYFDKTGAKFKFQPLSTSTMWRNFTSLLKVGALVAIA